MMNRNEVEAMPKALRILACQIDAPDHVPSMCLNDAAAMIESLRMQVADAVVSAQNEVPESARWISEQDLMEARKRVLNNKPKEK